MTKVAAPSHATEAHEVLEQFMQRNPFEQKNAKYAGAQNSLMKFRTNTSISDCMVMEEIVLPDCFLMFLNMWHKLTEIENNNQ